MDTTADPWDSEHQLISSLAKLQEMEATIHTLRTLLPDRVSGPGSSGPIPATPQILYAQLSATTRAGVAEVKAFQDRWRGPELAAVWEHVNRRIAENEGVLVQTTGVWERDYRALVPDGQMRGVGWMEFLKRGREGVRVRIIDGKDGNGEAVVVRLVKAGLGVRVSLSLSPGISTSSAPSASTSTSTTNGFGSASASAFGFDGDGTIGNGNIDTHTDTTTTTTTDIEWRVERLETRGLPETKLDAAVLRSLNQRERKWDLAFLLEMISSYANIKTTPCVKCGKMMDSAASLPTVRRVREGDEPGGLQSGLQEMGTGSGTGSELAWEAVHGGCV
ncbi:hypothetical protein BO70DRAFT_411968 [Aspergillus heteromorphus CBS 117.55]|uniref:Uncharacterized protein n=1 Tax=Aspergillus heteromorphus CBS 117.55 TaxID=1448321 RepID=A0A317VMD4_9EURO|nr:uncharacterized protein BO70DRAFT_411968 [Aspergillus heteromorphus CBS 117.55]PWY75533.1 hypothetical protein BO70DRAFT_411968 [Aspergillus heteromorphus CBS 117.55]